MKIIIATPLWPPELGGPANYAKNLAKEFKIAGHGVEVVSFARPVRSQPRRGVGAADPALERDRTSNGVKEILQVEPVDFGSVSFISLKFPSGLRHLLFFCKLLPKLYRADILLALDSFSVGLPAAMACLILRKPFVLRLEGDFLWESFVERTRKDITLREFYPVRSRSPKATADPQADRTSNGAYQKPQSLSCKERFIKKIISWVIKRASRLVFSSEWRRAMVLKSFNIALGKTVIIQNVWPNISNRLLVIPRSPQATGIPAESLGTGNQKIILWAGRMLYLKNLGRLIRAFARANDSSYELHLVGEGPDRENLKLQVKSLKLENKIKFVDPLPREELLKLYSEATFFVLPSLSDVGPNVITEAIAAKTPFIMTKESGYAEYVKNLGLLIDPLDEDDLTAKIKILMNDSLYKEYKNRLKLLVFRHDWPETAGEWMALFREVCRS